MSDKDLFTATLDDREPQQCPHRGLRRLRGGPASDDRDGSPIPVVVAPAMAVGLAVCVAVERCDVDRR